MSLGSVEARRIYMRNYMKAYRRDVQGMKPRQPIQNPQKPPYSLKATDPKLYARLYMRWYRYAADCDGANEWWK